MMKKIKIWYYILFVCTAVFVLRWNEIFDSLLLVKSFLLLLISSKINSESIFTFEVYDQIFSILFLIAIAIITITKRNKWKYLTIPINANRAVLITLIFIFIEAPMIAPFNPNLQMNLSAANKLKPLSSIFLVENNISSKYNKNEIDEYLFIKNKILREYVDDNYYLTDSRPIVENENISVSRIIFLFGTDEYGRDLFSRIVYSTRLSLLIGLGAVFVTFIIGSMLGFIAGYGGKFIDSLLSRFSEMFLAVPTIFLVILFLAAFGNSLWNVILVLGLASWMNLFKIVRGEVQLIKTKNFIQTSKQLGLSNFRIFTKDILPHLMPALINLVFLFANVIIAESSLSFLGLTGNHFYPSWGVIIDEGQYYLRQAWWISFFPCMMIVITLLTFYNFGRSLQLRFNPFIKNKLSS